MIQTYHASMEDKISGAVIKSLLKDARNIEQHIKVSCKFELNRKVKIVIRGFDFINTRLLIHDVIQQFDTLTPSSVQIQRKQYTKAFYVLLEFNRKSINNNETTCTSTSTSTKTKTQTQTQTINPEANSNLNCCIQ